jgi:DNA-binding NarL/FixJ family response regulator
MSGYPQLWKVQLASSDAGVRTPFHSVMKPLGSGRKSAVLRLRKGRFLVTRDERRTAVILDDHPLWLNALESLLEAASIEVVGAARSAEEALALVEQERPDLLVADLRLNGEVSGATCVREAMRRYPGLNAVIVSAYDDPRSVEEGLSSGASAFVSKAADPDDVTSAIRQVFKHSIFLATTPPKSARPSRQSDRLPGLTRREAEILELVAEGYSNAQVATMLWVTEQTVKFHLSNIYRKLRVANRTEAAHWALTHRLTNGAGNSQPDSRAAVADKNLSK